MKTECGIFALYSKKPTNHLKNILNGLNAIQNRGLDSCGIAFYNNINIDDANIDDPNIDNADIDKVKGDIYITKSEGTVSNLSKLIKNDQNNSLNKLEVNCAISQVRYTTSGCKNDVSGFQPLIGMHKGNKFVMAYNGNIPVMKQMYPDINLDSHGIIKFLENPKFTMKENMINFLKQIVGAYCISVLYKNKIYAMRDQNGFKPLNIGYNNNHSMFCIASETVSINEINFYYLRNINPGELIVIDENINVNDIVSYTPVMRNAKTNCLFEYIYFMRSKGLFDDIKIEEFRVDSGIQLAKNDLDQISYLIDDSINDNRKIIVVGCPNSGIPSGRGYVKYYNNLSKINNKYNCIEYLQIVKKRISAERTFILPDHESRISALKKKYELDKTTIKGNIIYLLDDSVVRGNTLNILLDQIKECSPFAIHVRIASPPVISECYFGIDIPTKDELIYNSYSDNHKLSKYYGVNSFKYLDLDYFNKKYNYNICTSCFTAKYDSKLLEW